MGLAEKSSSVCRNLRHARLELRFFQPTFPDHFHHGLDVEPSVQPTLHNVLDYISEQLKK